MTELLDALQEHHNDIDTTISIENTQSPSPPIARSIDLTKEGNKALREKFNTLYNLYVLKDQNSKQQVATMSFANEVFTMIPLVKKSDEARVTSSPSKGNQELINDIILNEIKDIDYTQLYNVCEQLTDIYSGIKDEANRYLNTINVSGSVINANMSRLKEKPPLLIYGEEVKSVLDIPLYILLREAQDIVNNKELYDTLYSDFTSTSRVLIIGTDMTLSSVYDLLDRFCTVYSSSISHLDRFVTSYFELKSEVTNKLQSASNISEMLDLVIDKLKFLKDALEYLKGPNVIDGLERLTAVL
jgi:hypothetical protein